MNITWIVVKATKLATCTSAGRAQPVAAAISRKQTVVEQSCRLRTSTMVRLGDLTLTSKWSRHWTVKTRYVTATAWMTVIQIPNTTGISRTPDDNDIF